MFLRVYSFEIGVLNFKNLENVYNFQTNLFNKITKRKYHIKLYSVYSWVKWKKNNKVNKN